MIPGEQSEGPGVPDRPVPDRSSSPPDARRGPDQTGGSGDALDTPERRARQEAWRGLDQGSVMTVELVTATLVWFGIGWLLDRLLGTMPWFMFAGALLGNWAGLYLIWLRGQRSEGGQESTKDAKNGHG